MSVPRPVLVTQIVARAILVVQLALGLLFWTGNADWLQPVHIAVGLLLVVDLWVAVVLGLRRGAPVVLAVLAVIWSIGMPIFGLRQAVILTGSAHVVIQVLHLLVGFLAIGLVEGLARSPGRRAARAA